MTCCFDHRGFLVDTAADYEPSLTAVADVLAAAGTQITFTVPLTYSNVPPMGCVVEAQQDPDEKADLQREISRLARSRHRGDQLRANQLRQRLALLKLKR